MKKSYIKPSSAQVAMQAESMLALSLTKNSSGGSMANTLGKRQGWFSDVESDNAE